MHSFNYLYLDCAKDTSDSTAGSIQYFKDKINEGQKIVENELDNFIIEDTRTGNTIAGFGQIPTPANYVRYKFLYVLSGTLRYDGEPVYSEDIWQQIVAFQQGVQSNFLAKVFPRITYLELFPVPSSILPYTLQYVSSSHDMQYDDYSTGSITSVTNTIPTNALPFCTVVGSGTTWTKYMAGMYFQMAGDKIWYKITSVTDATHLVLGNAYEGIAIAGFANTNYVIGEMPHLPEAAHPLLKYYALKEYYSGPKKDSASLQKWGGLFDKWLAWSKGTFSKRTETGYIPSQRNLRRFNGRNPNLFPIGIG